MNNKEYIGPEFEIEFARAWYEYVKSGKIGVDPRGNWEYSYLENRWELPTVNHPPCCNVNKYRWKPAPKRMVTILHADKDGLLRGKELVAPEVKAPEKGTDVWVLYVNGDIAKNCWEGMSCELSWLQEGNVFLTQEDAQAMADWLAVCRRGGV